MKYVNINAINCQCEYKKGAVEALVRKKVAPFARILANAPSLRVHNNSLENGSKGIKMPCSQHVGKAQLAHIKLLFALTKLRWQNSRTFPSRKIILPHHSKPITADQRRDDEEAGINLTVSDGSPKLLFSSMV